MLLQIEAGTLDLMGDPIPPAQFTDVTTNPDYKDQVHHHTLVDTRLRVHGHPAAEQRALQQREGPAGGQLRHRQGPRSSRSATVPASPANCIFPPDLAGYDPTCDPYPHDVERRRR